MAKSNDIIPRLTDLSMFCIITNFESFMTAYESCGSAQKKNFEYLQRARSKVVLKHLSKERTASKYNQFILNSFLKDVNLKTCVWDHRTVVKQLLVISKTIKKLHLFEYRCFPNLLRLACQMQNLESLTLHCSVVSKVLLQNIGRHCTSLKMLNLSVTNVTDDLIKALCTDKENCITHKKNTTIVRLDLSKTPVTVSGVRFILQHFPNLIYLQHKNVVEALCHIHSINLGNKNSVELRKFNLKNLFVLYEAKDFHKHILTMCRSLCPNITELSVGSVTSKTQLDAIAEFTALTKVKICGQRRTFIDLSSFLEARGKKLEVLVIKNSSISAELLPKFCPKLQFLKLENIHFNPLEELRSTPEKYLLPHLRVVTLEYMDFTIDSISKSTNFLLSCAPNLEKLKFLSIFSFKLDFIDIINIHSSLKNVQELVVVNSDINASDAKTLLSVFPHLRKYNLGDTPISFDDYKIMKELRPALRIITDYSDIFACPTANNADDSDSESSWKDGFEDGYSSDGDDESWTDISDYDLSDIDEISLIDDEDHDTDSSSWNDEDTSFDDHSSLFDGSSLCDELDDYSSSHDNEMEYSSNEEGERDSFSDELTDASSMEGL